MLLRSIMALLVYPIVLMIFKFRSLTSIFVYDPELKLNIDISQYGFHDLMYATHLFFYTSNIYYNCNKTDCSRPI